MQKKLTIEQLSVYGDNLDLGNRFALTPALRVQSNFRAGYYTESVYAFVLTYRQAQRAVEAQAAVVLASDTPERLVTHLEKLEELIKEAASIGEKFVEIDF